MCQEAVILALNPPWMSRWSSRDAIVFELHGDFELRFVRTSISHKLSDGEDSRRCLLWSVVCVKYLMDVRKTEIKLEESSQLDAIPSTAKSVL